MEETNVTGEPGAWPKEELNCCNVQNDLVADLVAHVDSCEMVIDKIKDEVENTFDIVQDKAETAPEVVNDTKENIETGIDSD